MRNIEKTAEQWNARKLFEGDYKADQPAAFAKPWHARLFGLTVALNESGHLNWKEWACRLAAKNGGKLAIQKDDEDSFYTGWLHALEEIASDKEELSTVQRHSRP